MNKKRVLITDFSPMRPLENYNCDTLNIVAAAKNTFLPELNPFNYEIGIFAINFDYDHNQLTEVEQINESNLRGWKDFNYFFEIQPENEYFALLEKNFGLKYLKYKEERVEDLLLQVEKNLERGSPVIQACNPYHLFYTDFYQKNPGGLFQRYHYIVVYGISRLDNKVWIYDPTLNNYNGVISLNDFINTIEDKRGIDDFEGFIYFNLQYNGKEYDDMNRELLLWALDYYLNHKKNQLKEKLLIFFKDYIYYYNNLSLENFKNKLLEFGFFIFKEVAYRRLHWWDFLEYYKNLEDIDHIQEEIDAFKGNVDKLFNLPNALYANSLKVKKKINLENLMNKLARVIDEEEMIFSSLYEKIK